MSMVKVEFYENGNIKSYQLTGFFVRANLSYDKDKGFVDKDMSRKNHEEN